MQNSQRIILPAQAPNTAEFIDIKNNHTLLRYFQNLQQHFMVANNFGLALDDEDRPVSSQPQAYLRNLFVPPHLSDRHFHPEQLIATEQQNQSQNWLDLAQVLKDHPRLFILGDPGAGKSTLLSWLMLALSHFGDNLTKMQIGERVPFLLVLRDLPLSQVKDWDTLWQVFLTKNSDRLTEPLHSDPELVNKLFASGQALLLIDGLDEVTEAEARRNLGKAVLEGINRYPRCGFTITSRLLGFDQHEWFGVKANRFAQENIDHGNNELEDQLLTPSARARYYKIQLTVLDLIVNPNLPIFYLTPFDLTQTRQFISNWYQQYQSKDSALPQRIEELNKRISQNDGLGRLARIPVLLNMICFIHSRRGRLPDGRAELYQRIAETYLISLDRARGINDKFKGREINYDYLDLCECLGKLALHLQDSRQQDDQALLLHESQVKNILSDVLTSRGMSDKQSMEEIQFILDYIAQRSGLFIPRGKNEDNQEQYGFTHLSFLEYFAAYALKLEAQIDQDCLTNRQDTTADAWWHECLALFFEQLEHPRLTEKYLNLLFAGPFNSLKHALLLAKIVMDSSVRLSLQYRHTRIKALWAYYLINPIALFNQEEQLAIFCELMWTDLFNSRDIFIEQALANNPERLALIGATINDISPLSGLSQLTELYLINTSISNLSPLAGLSQLTRLVLVNSTVSDLSPLAGLHQLTALSIANTADNDLSPLFDLHQLTELSLVNTAISDLSPLSNLNHLTKLNLFHNLNINDVSPLAKLHQLTELILLAPTIGDITPLAALSNLKHLHLPNKEIKGIELFNPEYVKFSVGN